MAKIQDGYYQFSAFSPDAFQVASGGRRCDGSPISPGAAPPFQAAQTNHEAYNIGAAPIDSPARHLNNSLYLPPFNSFAPVTRKKRGFFSRIGHAIKKFAGSNFGKLMLIGGAIAGSFLIPGLGAGIAKFVGGAGRALFGSAGNMFAQTGLKNLFQGGLKTFLKNGVVSRFGLQNGLKTGIQTFFKEQFLSPSALKSRAKDFLGRVTGGNFLPPKISGVLGQLGKLASDFGFDRAWLRDLISSHPAPPKNKPEYWL